MGIKNLIKPSTWKETMGRWKRTIDIARKPDKDEFVNASKITGTGMLLIGCIGFIVFLLYHLVTGGLI